MRSLTGAFSDCFSLTSVVIPDSVTNIGDGAFNECSGLTSVVIPDSVTSIGDYAFSGCSGLTSVVIGDGVKSIGSSAFYQCSGLTGELVIPDSVTSIGGAAFYYCSGLTSVVISDSVMSIGDWAFSGCSGLTSIIVDTNNSVYQSIDNCLIEKASKTLLLGCNNSIIPTDGSVTSIGNYAFFGCIGLTSVVIPDSVTSIGYAAFSNCSGLTNIIVDENNSVYQSIGNCLIERASKTLLLGCNNSIIPTDGSVTSIGDNAFWNCSGLTGELVIPDSVTSIGGEAFWNCSGLTSVVIPDSVTSIGDWAFSSCSGLTSVVIPDSVTSIGDYAFYNTGYYNNEENWENGVLYIGKHLIKAKSSLSGSYTIRESTLTIADEAFAGCSGLTSVVIPDSVTSIGGGAFYNCRGLTSVVIPDSVTSIGDYAFYECSGLTSVTFENPNGWWCSTSSTATSGESISAADLANTSTAAQYLKSTYYDYYWKRG